MWSHFVEELELYPNNEEGDENGAKNNGIVEEATLFPLPHHYSDFVPKPLDAIYTGDELVRRIYEMKHDFDGFDDIPDLPRRKFYHLADTFVEAMAVEDILFPQNGLQEKWDNFELETNHFMPPLSTFKKLEKQYSDIQATEIGSKNWFQVLIETNDDELVRHNVEYLISKNRKKKRYWKLYLLYLEHENIPEMLQTYSKYVRVFKKDDVMLKKYRQAVIKYGPVHVPWVNVKEFEIYEPGFFKKEKQRQSYKRTLKSSKVPCLIRFNPRNAAEQRFSFHKNLMKYIRDNANAKTLFKLYCTCKWFRMRSSRTVCCRLQVTTDETEPFEIQDLCLMVSLKWIGNTNLKNVHIANELCWKDYDNNHALSLSKFIPRIFKCDAKFVRIQGQRLTWNEIKLLTGSKDLKHLNLTGVKNENGEAFKLEDILQAVPTIQSITLSGVVCTKKTYAAINNLDFKSRIHKFCLDEFESEILLSATEFAKFAIKSLTPDVFLVITFAPQNRSVASQFKEIVETAMMDHWGDIIDFEEMPLEIY